MLFSVYMDKIVTLFKIICKFTRIKLIYYDVFVMGCIVLSPRNQ